MIKNDKMNFLKKISEKKNAILKTATISMHTVLRAVCFWHSHSLFYLSAWIGNASLSCLLQFSSVIFEIFDIAWQCVEVDSLRCRAHTRELHGIHPALHTYKNRSSNAHMAQSDVSFFNCRDSQELHMRVHTCSLFDEPRKLAAADIKYNSPPPEIASLLMYTASLPPQSVHVTPNNNTNEIPNNNTNEIPNHLLL